ncbi:spiroplasma phage ORF1-like family protein [Spiroplasma endosymbiont of Polydrusus formosus]
MNITLKTSKSLTYNNKWYLDFLKYSYSMGISICVIYDEPAHKL